MHLPSSPTEPDSLGRTAGPAGNLPGTEASGLILLERVNVERRVGSEWTVVAVDVPATFEPLSIERRVRLQPWTRKPLLGLWLLPNAGLQDGDRVVRSDGAVWTVRGTPLLAPGRTHIAALTEGETEDALFAEEAPPSP